MEESSKICGNDQISKNKAMCDRQNSELLTRLHSLGPSNVSEIADNRPNEYGPSQKHEKSAAPKTVYVEIDKHVDVSKGVRNGDFVVVVKPPPYPEVTGEKFRNCSVTKICKYVAGLLMLFASIVAMSVVSDIYIVPIFSGKTKPLETEQVVPERPHAESLTGSRPNDTDLSAGSFHWATFYMDQDNFTKGMARLPWKLEEEGGTGISLTSSGCFSLSRGSVYEIYSKVTFVFNKHNVSDSNLSPYHNVQLLRDNDRDILDKNILSAPYLPPKATRVFQTSSLIVLGEFQAGDSICVYVSDTSLVYETKDDNTVKIIQRGN